MSLRAKSQGEEEQVVGRFAYDVDPTKTPKHITIWMDQDPWFGIYKFDKGDLVICWVESSERLRPKTFESGSENVKTWVLRRRH